MAEENPYAPHLFDPRPKPTGALPYPTQSKKPATPQEKSRAGELRGYYGAPQFNPYPSRYGAVRPTNHWGVDIYAPYWPFPHEIPVYAVCDGRAEFIYDNEKPDGLGNRVWLYPNHAPNDRVILGHLNRFVGRDRKVQKGDLLGFSGCSGNADTLGECTKRGGLRINSGHVHLAYRQHAVANPVDPLAKLGWSLRFDAVVDPSPLGQWAADGHLLDEPALPEFTRGVLRIRNARPSEPITKSAEPSKLSAPFDTIDFDNRAAMNATARFYSLAHTRLKEDEYDHPKAKFHKHATEQFEKSTAEAAAMLNRLVKIEQEFRTIFRKPVPLPERIQLAQTLSAEFVFECIRLLWLAMAGEAMLLAAKNPGPLPGAEDEGEDPVPGGLIGLVPRSGIGLWGNSVLVSLDNGRAAMQASFLRKLVDDAANPGKKKVIAYSDWTLSVSFGAGTPWHAVLDQKVVNEAGPSFHEYFGAMRGHIILVDTLASVICTRAEIFDSDGLQRFLSSVGTTMGLISSEAEHPGTARRLLTALEDIDADSDLVMSLMKSIAKTSHAAAAQAGECLDPSVKQINRVRSGYKLIWITKAA